VFKATSGNLIGGYSLRQQIVCCLALLVVALCFNNEDGVIFFPFLFFPIFFLCIFTLSNFAFFLLLTGLLCTIEVMLEILSLGLGILENERSLRTR